MHELKTWRECSRTGARITRRHVFAPGGRYLAEHITLSTPATMPDRIQDAQRRAKQ